MNFRLVDPRVFVAQSSYRLTFNNEESSGVNDHFPFTKLKRVQVYGTYHYSVSVNSSLES